jgi:predicted nucleotidyltransferase
MEDIKKMIVPVLRRYGVRRAAVFGSFARGEAREDSDLDIIVEFEEGRSLLDLAGLKVELEDVLGRRVTLLRMVPCIHSLGKEFSRRKRGYYEERPEKYSSNI